MAVFKPSQLTVDASIIGLLEAISRKQGQLSGLSRYVQDDLRIAGVAAVDAVHFSTRIEGNALTRDQVTQALEKGKVRKTSRDLREVLNYARARRESRAWVHQGKPFNDEWVLQHHAALLNGILKGKLRGHYREAQCVITDARSREIIYLAPQWQDVAPLMKGLLGWLRSQRAKQASVPLIAAQFHFEFVTIHPFMDGNGRLARLLTNSVLLAGGYDVEGYAALEKQHELDRVGYYAAMRGLQAGTYYDIPPNQDIRTWITYWLKCLADTYDEALERVGAIQADPQELIVPSHDRLKRARSLFQKHGSLRAAEYADLTSLARTQAVADLNSLVKEGVLERVGGGRSTAYRVKKRR